MIVLLTGAAGFIGYHLGKRLVKEPEIEKIFLVDNFIRGRNDEEYKELCSHPKAHHITLDLADVKSFKLLPDHVDCIIHLAALNGTQNFYERPVDVIRSCVLPTINLIGKYAWRGRALKFVFASSSEVYASTVNKFGWEVPTAENVPLSIDDVYNPRWSYAASKILDEVLVVNASRQWGMKYIIIRYHNIYGPRMGDKHVIPDFIERMKRGELALFGYNNTRSFMYIDDAVEATWLLIRSPKAVGEIINVGSTKEVTILELAKTLMRIAGVKGDLQLKPPPAGSVYRRVPAIEKLRKLTGFTERWTLEQGLTETLRYYWPERLGRLAK